MAKSISTIIIVLIGGYVLGAVAWAVFSVLWEDFGETIKARWPRWVIVVFPLLFTIYIGAFNAVTMWRLRQAARDYDATRSVQPGRATVSSASTAVPGRANVPRSRVIDGEWR